MAAPITENGNHLEGAKKRDPECEAIRPLVEEYLRVKPPFDIFPPLFFLIFTIFILIIMLNPHIISEKTGLIGFLLIAVIFVFMIILDERVERARLRRVGIPEEFAPLVRRCAEKYEEELRAEDC